MGRMVIMGNNRLLLLFFFLRGGGAEFKKKHATWIFLLSQDDVGLEISKHYYIFHPTSVKFYENIAYGDEHFVTLWNFSIRSMGKS